MAMLSRSPGDLGDIPLRTLLYSSGPLPLLHDYPLKSGLNGTHVIADVLLFLSHFAISRDRVAKSTLWQRHAMVEGFDYVGEALDLQVPERRSCGWLQ
jgi:hypothetical protein